MQRDAAQPGHGNTAPALTLASGQIFTPPDVAQLLASHLEAASGKVRVLDAGAGAGALCDAVLTSEALRAANRIELTAVERDPVLAEHLVDAARHWSADRRVTVVVKEQDFIELALKSKAAGMTYDLIVTNPPYVRLRSSMPEYDLLRTANVKVPNLYAAFLWLAADLLAPNGQIVAITPRSFCSGTRFEPLRKRLQQGLSLDALHLFESREAIFERDGVLQEALITKFTRREQRTSVHVSRSVNAAEEGVAGFVSRDSVLSLQDDHPICIPAMNGAGRNAAPSDHPIIAPPATASTGSVVDFRMDTHITSLDDEAGTVPLIGSETVRSDARDLPVKATRYLRRTTATAPHIFPPGNYVVVGRISPKEASPRIRARLIPALYVQPFGGVAFENHLNVIHAGRKGLGSETASAILHALRDPAVEQQFVERSGTTQVNLSDLRALRFPLDDIEGDTTHG